MSVTLLPVIVLLSTPPPMARAPLDLCALWAHASELRGTLVVIRGEVTVGYETLTLDGLPCERIALSLGGRAAVRRDGPVDGPAAAAASFEEFLSAAKGDLDAIPHDRWLPVVAVAPTKDPTWRKFENAVFSQAAPTDGVPCVACQRYRVVATLEGYLDCLLRGTSAAGRVERDDKGKLVYLGGLGHQNMFAGRLVVTRVLEFKALTHQAKRP